MKDNILIFLASSDGKFVAGSINYKKGRGLYGRYWGCVKEFHFLHFELCYYQTIEYAILNNFNFFEAGAQGEHKIQRGFLPEITYSAHWIKHKGFRKAIYEFLDKEKEIMNTSIINFKNSPFKNQN